jgi:hypothetical protein
MSASPEGSLILRPIRLVGYRSYVGFAEPLCGGRELNPANVAIFDRPFLQGAENGVHILVPIR